MGPSMILPLTKRHHPRKKAPRKRGHLASLRARRPRLPGARSQRKRPGSCTGRCKTMSGSTSNWTIIGCKKMQWCNDMINRIYIYTHTRHLRGKWGYNTLENHYNNGSHKAHPLADDCFKPSEKHMFLKLEGKNTVKEEKMIKTTNYNISEWT